MFQIKRSFIVLFLIVSSIASAKTFYVSTIGKDSNPGTLSQSWLTWQKAFTMAVAGDTVYFRGGTYPTTVTDGWGLSISNSGTAGNYICFFAYPDDYIVGNYPTLDCAAAGITGIRTNDGIRVANRSYLHFRGLQVINVHGPAAEEYVCNGIVGWYLTNVKFENCIVHDIDGVGFGMFEYHSVYLTNCDAYNCGNVTNLTRPGDAGTGIALVSGNEARKDSYAYAYGCRAWNCSDQGFTNGGGAGYAKFDNCWSWDNGKLAGNLWGMGHGFKYSYLWNTPTTDTICEIFNCIAAENNSMGFAGNDRNNEGNYMTYNCVSYHNGDGWENIQYNNNITEWGFVNYSVTNESPGFGRVLKNNLSFDNYSGDYICYGGTVTVEYNSWNTPPGVTVNAADFQSLDYTQLARPRKADGSLPDINFLKLAPGSDLIDQGIDVGLPFNGSAPDLGYSEYLSSSGTPAYTNSVIENATPAKLEMIYNITLANIVPPASAFIVTVNSVTRTVNSVSVSDTKVLLTLASPVNYSDIVKVTYAKPSSNPLQNASGSQAASVTAQNVTNNVGPVSPVYISSVIANATPSRLEMTYNLNFANIIPPTSAFSVNVNSVTRSVSSVAVSGTKVLLTLASPVVYGDLVTVAYTKPASNPLQTVSGSHAASLTPQSTANNCTAPDTNQPPLVDISSPTKSTSFISPATITIDAVASDPDGTIVKVEYYNGSTKLGERTIAPYSFTWKDVSDGTYSITATATDNLNAKTISAAVSVTVEKPTTAVNQLPVVTITSPSKSQRYKKHDNIVIEVVASDPDGSISKVELKSGNVTIAEMLTAPYIYIWENADTGIYTMTAIATDNLNATTSSSTVELIVYTAYDVNSEFINLYPNPNDGHFSIDMFSLLSEERSSVTIISLTGETVYNDIILAEESTKEFDLSDIAAGPYVVMITSGNTISTTKKFIKK